VKAIIVDLGGRARSSKENRIVKSVIF